MAKLLKCMGIAVILHCLSPGNKVSMEIHGVPTDHMARRTDSVTASAPAWDATYEIRVASRCSASRTMD